MDGMVRWARAASACSFDLMDVETSARTAVGSNIDSASAGRPDVLQHRTPDIDQVQLVDAIERFRSAQQAVSRRYRLSVR